MTVSRYSTAAKEPEEVKAVVWGPYKLANHAFWHLMQS